MSQVPRFMHFIKRPEWWSDKKLMLKGRPPFAIHVRTGGPAPSSAELAIIVGIIDRLSEYVTAAAARIEKSCYSYEDFLCMGVPRLRLVQNPTPSRIAAKMSIRSVTVFDLSKPNFAISFEAEWDDYHTYEVSFLANNCVVCSVISNGLKATDIREHQLCIPNRAIRETTSNDAMTPEVLKQIIINELQWCGFGRGKRLRGKLIHLHEEEGRPKDPERLRDYPTLQAKPLIKRVSRSFRRSSTETCQMIDQMLLTGVVSLSFGKKLLSSAFDL